MAQTTSNVVPAAQQALNNQATWAQKQSALRALGARNFAASQAKPNLNLSMAGGGTVQPMNVSAAGTTGSATPTGLTQGIANPYSAMVSGIVNPRTITPAQSQPLATATLGQPGGTNALGTHILTQAELDAQNAQKGTSQFNTGAATSGGAVGSTNDQTGGITGGSTSGTTGGATGTPYSATNPPTSQAGLIGSALGQAQGYFNQQQALTPQAQAVQKAIADMQARIGGEQSALTGQYSGTASDEAGRIAQLEQIKQSTAAAMGQQAATIEAEQAKLAGFEAPLTNTYGTAIGAAQPQLGAYGQTFYQPLQAGQGGATGGAGVSPSDPFYKTLQSYAQMAASGQISAVPSSVTSNPVLNAQMNEMAKQINPDFNPITSAAQGGVLSTIPAMQSANTAAKGIEQSITSFLNQNPQLNSSPLAAGNAAQQWIQGKQLADPNYQQLFNMLSEYTNTLAPILGVGGDPTNLKTQIAQGFINAQASGQSIAQVLQGISQLADQKIKNLQSGATGGGVVTSSSTGTSVSGFGWNG